MSQRVAVDGKVFVDYVESSIVIAAGAEVAVPSVEREKNFGVILRGIIFSARCRKNRIAQCTCCVSNRVRPFRECDTGEYLKAAQ